MASIDVDPFTTAKHARRGHLAGAVLWHASLVGLCLTLWGTLLAEVWRADDAVMADVPIGAPSAGDIVRRNERRASSGVTREGPAQSAACPVVRTAAATPSPGPAARPGSTTAGRGDRRRVAPGPGALLVAGRASLVDGGGRAGEDLRLGDRHPAEERDDAGRDALVREREQPGST